MLFRVPPFQPGGVRNFNFYPQIGYVLCVLSCVVFGGGPDIVLTIHSWRLTFVYMSSVGPQSDPWVFWLEVLMGEGK